MRRRGGLVEEGETRVWMLTEGEVEVGMEWVVKLG